MVDLLRGSDGKGGDKRPFFSLEEITAIFGSDRVRLTSDGAEFLCAISCLIGSGMLRMAATIWKKADYAARRRNYQVDAPLLRKATEGVLFAAGIVDEQHPIWRQIETSLTQIREFRRRTAAERAAAAG